MLHPETEPLYNNLVLLEMFLKIIYKFLPILYPLAVGYWKLTKPKTRGAIVVVRWEGKILLVKNTYGSRRWALPGGSEA